MTVYLVPPGRGRWSPLVLHWDAHLRNELPLPLDLKSGDKVSVLGVVWRVAKVIQ